MRKHSVLSLVLLVSVFFVSLSWISAETNSLAKISGITTTRSQAWAEMAPISLAKSAGGRFDVQIDPASTEQRIDGFGGCFNEKGWEALSLLSSEKREAVLKAFFDPKDGAKFNICRMPIGASDYALDRYTLNETKDDFEMKNFSIERDRKHLIPFIKAAMKVRPDLRIWGSAWTPPTWMKTNGDFDGGWMKDDPKVYAAFALYLARFIESYQAEGIHVFAAAVQNEPMIKTAYPSCLWTPKQFLVFVRDYLGPTFKQRKVDGQIMLGTMQDPNYYAFPQTVLSDPEANRYVSIVGYQWDGLKSVAQTREEYPDKTIMQTETECGNWHWKPGFDPNKPQNDWAYGVYTWDKIKSYFDEGVNSYMLWNMILDEEGKSIDAVRPWPQNAAVVVDKKTKEVIYTPMFYAFKHFSYFIEPGARYLNLAKGSANAIAFRNPDGKIVLLLQNLNKNEKKLKVGVGGHGFNLTLPGSSWSTLVIPAVK